jgi:hypothetical protein
MNAVACHDIQKRAVGLGAADHKTQEKLRIVAGVQHSAIRNALCVQ